MKTLNDHIKDYTHLVQQGEIQIAYKGILDFLGKLRSELIHRYPHYHVNGIYQGTMDMSYFSLTTPALQDQGLKIALVYLHDKGDFEVWLSARNRDIAQNFASKLKGTLIDNAAIFHDEGNLDAIVECKLVSTPDFEDQVKLITTIEVQLERFLSAIQNRIA